MPMNKEWSAVAALLDKINSLEIRVKELESYFWIWRTESITATRWSYTNLTDTIPTISSARDVVWYRWNIEDDTFYAVTDDNITVPIFIPTNSNVEPRTFTSCRSSHI